MDEAMEPRAKPSRRPLWRLGRRRRPTFLAAAMVLAILNGGGCTAAGASPLPSSTGPDTSASSAPTATPSPDVTPTATPSLDVTPTATPSADLAPGFTWTSAPDEGDETLGEIAVLLADGRVLVMAGCATDAQLLDVATGTYTTTGSLTEQRGGKTATLLTDDRVLVTGGYDCASSEGGISRSAEIYDPATGTFEATGAMRDARQFHTATLLDDGRVLITGGHSNSSATAARGVVFASVRTAETSSSVLSTAEVFDPATDSFRPAGSMSTFRDHHTATRLSDGTVLVVGGGDEGYESVQSADRYDPATDEFQATGSTREGRSLHTASLLADGRVLVVGGRSPGDTVSRSAETYDPGSGTFSPAGAMHEGRQQHTATVLPDGRVLIAGGSWGDGQNWRMLSATEMYDPGAGTFTSIGSMGDARSEHTATLLRDGRVLILGGIDIASEDGIQVKSAVLYEP